MSYVTAACFYGGLSLWTVALAFIAVVSDPSFLSQYLPFLNYQIRVQTCMLFCKACFLSSS
jgi:hypothetical protein